jgi:AcrR family transcriptional regulator
MAATSRMPREARRAQLIDAAAATFRRSGYEKTSMDEIAQAAGVTRLILYRNFGSKEDLYRQVLRQLLVDLGAAFEGLSFDQVAELGAASVIMPVARSHADSFRLLWRDASREPQFEDLATEFRTYVSLYARAILATFIPDELVLDWAARTAGAHLVDGICNWLDDGDPARDAEIVVQMTAGLRALAGAWSASAVR